MIVLHAMWDSVESKKLHIWGESSEFRNKQTSHTRKRKQKQKTKPQLHPFALSRDKLKKDLTEVSSHHQEVNFDILTILLPSSKKGPLPSPGLPVEERSYEEHKELKAWFVDTITLYPDTALDFLLTLPAAPPMGRKYGSTLRFWTEVAKFSLELIFRQRFVPALNEYQQNGDKYYVAEWNAVITEDDYNRLQVLSKAMPPCCRAFNGNGLKSSEIITDFLNSTMDSFIRNSLKNRNISLLPEEKSKRKKPTCSEGWLKALSEDPVIETSDKQAKKFSRELEKWLYRILPVGLGAPFRTCFRLEPPEKEGEHWNLTFHLQANDDKSLLVPAEKVWETDDALTILKRRFENPQEKLLEDLGRASEIFPEIKNSLQTARPVCIDIDTDRAYEFLREYAPLLEQNGFGVLLPAWWEAPSAKLGVKLRLKPREKVPETPSGFLGLNNIVKYDWKIALGDETLSQEEFEELANLKTPLVQVKGQWVELRKEDIEKAIAFFQEKQADNEMEMEMEMEMGQAMRLALTQEDPEAMLPVVDVEAEGWLEELFEKLSGGVKVSRLRPPKTFNGKLRPYQIEGLSWLNFLKQFGFGACLADDMGLGKTIQFIALMLKERSGKGNKNPALVICPMSVITNWKKEIERFAPSLKVMVHHGQNRLGGKEFENEVGNYDVVISTYALALRDIELLSSINWHCIALDEAQNIKNPVAKQTKAIKQLKANYRVALTGTPLENRLSELWSIMDFLNPGYLQSLKEFRNSFAIPVEKYRDPKRSETLKSLIQPFILRRLKSDPKIIKDLPEKIEMKSYCDLTAEQASLYEASVREMMEKIEDSSGIQRKGLVLSTLMSLKQICNHPALFMKDGSSLSGRSGKLSRLTEMLEEVLAEGDKALIFTQFAEMGMMLRYHLQETFGRETLFLHGGTGKKQREAMISRFQDGDSPLFILSLKAGGLGLNLTAANHVFHFDRWWNPAVENQATDRAFRIGQKKNVQVHKFVCMGTLEERIDAMIEQKKELAGNIVGSGEDWLTELSTDQLRELFSLSEEIGGG